MNSYKTTIDYDFLYGIDGTGINKPPTDLAIAAVMIHEMVHTFFFSLFDDQKNNGYPKALDNFDILYKEFVLGQYTGTDDAHHLQIWKDFIGIMSSSLQEFHTGIPTSSPSQFYQDVMMVLCRKQMCLIADIPMALNAVELQIIILQKKIMEVMIQIILQKANLVSKIRYEKNSSN